MLLVNFQLNSHLIITYYVILHIIYKLGDLEGS